MLNADALSQLRQLKSDIKDNKVVFPGTVKATNGRFGFVALDEGLQRNGRQVIRTFVGEFAVAAAEGGPDGIDDV